MPVGCELPFAQRERVHLKWLGQLSDIESKSKRRFITHAFDERVDAHHRARRYTTDESLDIAERFERLAKRSARDAILARQRRIRYSISDRPFSDFLVQPIP